MQKRGSFKESLCGKGGFGTFGRCPAIWGLNTCRAGLLLALVSTALHGCVILPIPTPEHDLVSGRGEVTEADTVGLEVGKTMREEVLLRFGEPSGTLQDERVFLYHWSTVRGYVIWAVGWAYAGRGDIVAVPKDYLLLLEFDESGRLRRFERTSLRLFESVTERVDQWSPAGSARLADIEKAAKSGVYESRGRFVIKPVLMLGEQRGSALAGVSSVRVKIADFVDERTAGKGKLIGQRKAAFGVVTHDVYLASRLSDVVRHAIASQWEAAGHRLVEDNPDVTVTGRVTEFKVETSLSLSSWDAVSSLEVIIEVGAKSNPSKAITRRYHSQQVEKTVFGPSEKHFEGVILSCLQDLMRQMASDVDLARYVAGEQIHGSPNQTLQPTAKSGG